MITILLLVSVAVNLLAAGVVYDLCTELRTRRRSLEEETAWSGEYARRAQLAETELERVRREYAVLNWLHDGTIMLELGTAWRAGMGVGKR